jgi:hypothetical protein
MTMRRLFLLPLAIALAGCGGNGLKTAPVSGRVTLNGKPLADASVLFSPIPRLGVDNNPGPGSGARTDADGRFTLMLITGKDVKGAVVGKHKVQIKMIPDANPTDDSPQHFKNLPKHYGGKDTKLEFDVPADGTKTANFDLTDP